MKKDYSTRRVWAFIMISFLIISLSFSLTGCGDFIAAIKHEQTEQEKNVTPPDPEPEPEPITERTDITLTALGDILMHNTLIWSGGQADGSYAFDFFREVRSLMEEGDYCTTNLECALAGPESGYTGYPLFNSPDAIATHLKDYGVDGVIAANNHILDRGFKGALRTVEVIENAGLDVLGIRKNIEDTGFIIKDLKGIKVGYLAYTYGTNGLSLPAEHQYFINMLEKERILQDLQELRPQVDILILVLHWGVEYSPEPTEEQRTLAQEFLAAGADAIIGSHPHVIQPVEYFNIDGQKKFVAYSIGNFIGDQRGQERNSGVIVQLKFEVERVFQPETTDIHTGAHQAEAAGNSTFHSSGTLISQKVTLQQVELTPTYSHSYTQGGRQKFRVIPVERTMEKILAEEDDVFTIEDLPLLENVLQTTNNRLNLYTGAE